MQPGVVRPRAVVARRSEHGKTGMELLLLRIRDTLPGRVWLPAPQSRCRSELRLQARARPPSCAPTATTSRGCVPQTRIRCPGTDLRRGTSDAGRGTRDLGPETRDLGAETWDPRRWLRAFSRHPVFPSSRLHA